MTCGAKRPYMPRSSACLAKATKSDAGIGLTNPQYLRFSEDMDELPLPPIVPRADTEHRYSAFLTGSPEDRASLSGRR